MFHCESCSFFIYEKLEMKMNIKDTGYCFFEMLHEKYKFNHKFYMLIYTIAPIIDSMS